jgi:type I restriction enzyme S subunit
VLIRANRKKLNPQYLTYLLLGDDIQGRIASVSNGATVHHLNMKDIRGLEIPSIPDLPGQDRIADILSAYDDLMENNTRRIKVLEQMAQMIYREWFVNFRFPGHENLPMVESESGPMPEGWSVRRLETFGAVVTGKTPSTERSEFYGVDVPFIKTPDMHGNLFCVAVTDHLSTEGAESQRNKTIPPNSIMVNCIGALAGSVSISTRPSHTNQQINTVVLNSQLDREFLYLSLTALRDALRQIGSNGATMINVNKTKFESLAMVTPPPSIVGSFHDLTCAMFDEVRNLQTRTINLRTTRDLLLPKLISGEVPVEAAKNVAAELQEEIAQPA